MAVAPERLQDDLKRLVHRSPDVAGLALGAARILARAVPFDGVCLLTMDPATLLPTHEVVENGLPPAATSRMTEIEVRGDDVNSFAELARSARRAASLSEATDGQLDRSLRQREVRRPNGLGDELRAVLVDESAAWGALTLLRAGDHRHFTPGEVALVASVSGVLAEGVRRATLHGGRSADDPGGEPSSGVALLAPDNTVTHADGPAEAWLAELGERHPSPLLPSVVTAVAGHARRIAAGNAPHGGIARARVRTPSGRWLLVRASVLGDGPDAPIAVTLELARPHELAPLIADTYRLAERERAVTELVAQGHPTDAIAARLHISPWTVQDHLKAIFEKTGVGSRGELVARIFFDHYAPRLTGDSSGEDPSPGKAPA